MNSGDGDMIRILHIYVGTKEGGFIDWYVCEIKRWRKEIYKQSLWNAKSNLNPHNVIH